MCAEVTHMFSLPEEVDELIAQLDVACDVDEETRERADHEECTVDVAPPLVPAHMYFVIAI